ncbi:MAG: hypothetical protein AAGK32_10980 [Actinomycetota bacterium]
MGWLRRLAFWRRRTVDLDNDIEGCFTLPEAPAGQPSATDEA